MHRLLACLALLALAGLTEAGRVPSRKADGQRDPGPRGDVTVPYLTNGNTTLGVYQGVAPKVISDASINDPKNAGVLPVYNLPFYGSKTGVNDTNPGAMPRPANQLRRR